jgi:hypothetical protein
MEGSGGKEIIERVCVCHIAIKKWNDSSPMAHLIARKGGWQLISVIDQSLFLTQKVVRLGNCQSAPRM